MIEDFSAEGARRSGAVCRFCHHFVPVNFADGAAGWGCAFTAREDGQDRLLPFAALAEPSGAAAALREYSLVPAPEECAQYLHLFMSGGEDAGEREALAGRLAGMARTTVGELPADALDFLAGRKIDPAAWQAEHAADEARAFGDGRSFVWCGLDPAGTEYGFEPRNHWFFAREDARRMRFVWRASDDLERIAMLSHVFVEAERAKADIIYVGTMAEDGCDGLLDRAGFYTSLFQTGCGRDGRYAQIIRCRGLRDERGARK